MCDCTSDTFSDPVSVLDHFTHSRQHTLRFAHRSTSTESTVSTRMYFLFNNSCFNFNHIFFIIIFYQLYFLSFMSRHQEAKDIVNSILVNQHGSHISIPRFFQEVRMLRFAHVQSNPWRSRLAKVINYVFAFQVYPDQALLLLVTGALSLRIVSDRLSPALPVLNTFKVTSCSFLP